MKVKKLPFDAGPAGWNAILPEVPASAPLDQKLTSDWLVVGSGFAGLSAARRLRQLDPTGSITLLEARRVAEGPAGRNSGFMIDLPHVLSSEDYGGKVDHDRIQTSMNRKAIAFAAEAAEEWEMPEEALRLSGKTNAAASDKGVAHNHDYARHLEQLQERHELLDHKAMAEMTGTTYYKNGLYTPGTAMLQPAVYIRGLANGLRHSNVRIYEQSPVTNLERVSEHWLATTPNGSISAPKIILAVNGHIESFGFFKRRLMPIFLYASMTRALRDDEVRKIGGRDRWGVTPADPMGTTVRKISDTGGHRIVTRNRVTFDPSMKISVAQLAAAARHHDRSFARRFPSLAGIDMEYRWSGQLCLARNDVPAFGELEDGLYSACCQNGLGTAKGTLSGMAAAELATGIQSADAEFLMQQEAPTKLPPEPFSTVGANALIRWKEYRAGLEK